MAVDILAAGYDPTEATVDSVVVEVDIDAGGAPTTTFSDHFKANAGMDPDHYVDQAAIIRFAGLSRNRKQLTERSMYKGMPGCACEPNAAISLEFCGCMAKPILDDTCRYDMNKLQKADLN